MPAFQYTVLAPGQGRRQGTLEATDAAAAAAVLRTQGLFVLRLVPQQQAAEETTLLHRPVEPLAWLRRLPWPRRGFGTQDRIFLLEQLALMLRSGLTLVQALEVAAAETEKPRLRQALEQVAERLQQGQQFSQALASVPGLVPEFVLRLVQSGEVTGQLEHVLGQSAQYLRRRAVLRGRLASALVYPAVVVLVALAVAAFLVLKVIPKFATFFSRRGAALPWATQLLVDLSNWLGQYGLYVLGAVVAAGLGLAAFRSTAWGRLRWDRLLLRLPVLGPVLATAAMSQLSQTLGMLLASGLNLLEALRITAGVIGNHAVRRRVQEAAQGVLEGGSLAGSLRGRPVPELVPRMIAVGERTGSLGEVLEELGRFYDAQLQNHIRRLSAMVEPTLILVVGLLVGFVYFAFFQAVIQMGAIR